MRGVNVLLVDGGGTAESFRPDRKRLVPLRVLGQPRRLRSLETDLGVVALHSAATSELAHSVKSGSGSRTRRSVWSLNG